MSTPTAETLRSLYDAAGRRDGEAMARCYAPDATFRDEVFRLSGTDVGDMWRMLMGRSTDLRVTYEIAGEDQVDWMADYTFEGHPVHNVIASSFTFDPDGRILAQTDRFDFAAWAGQALGLKGKLLGRFAFFHDAVRKQTAARLAAWQRGRIAEGAPDPGSSG